jgi:hypothetical protein
MSVRAVSRVRGLVSLVLRAAVIGGCSSSSPGRPDGGGGSTGGSVGGARSTIGEGQRRRVVADGIASGTVGFFTGDLDEIRWYSRGLSAAEVGQLFSGCN